MHHRDGNWRNDAPTNLVLLCPDCHPRGQAQGGRGSRAGASSDIHGLATQRERGRGER